MVTDALKGITGRRHGADLIDEGLGIFRKARRKIEQGVEDLSAQMTHNQISAEEVLAEAQEYADDMAEENARLQEKINEANEALALIPGAVT